MTNILTKIFPKEINNEFTGYTLSQYAFIFIIIITITRSLTHIIFPDGGAGSIATIDLNVQGANIIIAIFAQWGLSQLLMGFVYLIVYIRYKDLIPLMYLIYSFEYIGRMILGLMKPIETIGVAPGAAGNGLLILLGVVFFIFAILEPKKSE